MYVLREAAIRRVLRGPQAATVRPSALGADVMGRLTGASPAKERL